jgi:hypothetical protein
MNALYFRGFRIGGRAAYSRRGYHAMIETRIQDQSQALDAEYDEKLAQTILGHEELQRQLRKLLSSWEAERSQLKMKILQLEHSLVDVIERSNNPLRTELLAQDKIRLIEEAKREWTAQWDAERKQLVAEIKRLRSSM